MTSRSLTTLQKRSASSTRQPGHASAPIISATTLRVRLPVAVSARPLPAAARASKAVALRHIAEPAKASAGRLRSKEMASRSSGSRAQSAVMLARSSSVHAGSMPSSQATTRGSARKSGLLMRFALVPAAPGRFSPGIGVPRYL